ncbi:MAG: cytochrome C oxidase subunit IV family protein [Kangiellaceae bacterium]|nr:cytochrome C oxidase subunit IV family protein [Kangiellaceae bacterium]
MSNNTELPLEPTEQQSLKQQRPQQHPIGIYLKVWVLLFVLSTLSYLVDFYQVQGYLRWTLILIFMFLKAGLIVSFFMHLVWERLSLIYTILVPTLAILVFILLMAYEADYVFNGRLFFFSQ